MNRDDRQYPDRPIVGVGAVILVDAECTLEGIQDFQPAPCGVVLVKRRFEPLAGHWSLPGGALEVGETLEAGVAREILEETGLVVDVGGVIEVFDRIMFDDEAPGDASIHASGGQRVRHHYVLIDYLCRPTGGVLRAGSDVSEAVVADPRSLAQYAVTAKVEAVVARALEMRK
jgi:8-oxo-dGTP diphosphatase